MSQRERSSQVPLVDASPDSFSCRIAFALLNHHARSQAPRRAAVAVLLSVLSPHVCPRACCDCRSLSRPHPKAALHARTSLISAHPAFRAQHSARPPLSITRPSPALARSQHHPDVHPPSAASSAHAHPRPASRTSSALLPDASLPSRGGPTMDQYGNQMPSYADQDTAPQRPQSQAMSASGAGAGKPPPGGPPKPHHNVSADVKPRLTKEQHDILESHFQQQHKPSTSTKKGFAEALNVPVDKINNWFQNRRAKVKQDLKKQFNQYNMSMGVYGSAPHQMPLVNSQFQQTEQSQPQPQTNQDFYPGPVNADISPTCLPVQSVEGPSALELGSQLPLHQTFDMHPGMLRPIPEADRSMLYHPNAVMQSFMAATAGAPYMQNSAASLPAQESGFRYDTTGLPPSYAGDLSFSIPSSLPNDSAAPNDVFDGFSDLSGFDYASLTATSTSGSADVQHSTGSLSSEPSPFSSTQSNATTQSSGGPNTSSVTSIASMFSGYNVKNASEDMKPANHDDSFDSPYAMRQASASEQALPFWAQHGHSQSFSHSDMYQHNNASAHAILSSPDQADNRKLSAAASDLEIPHTLGDDMYSRRNSSATNLANNIEAIHIQGSHTPEGFNQPSQPSSIAARRHKRPTALNATTLRSASYTGGMPSPGANNDHTLRRIRSSGIANAGRVQKSTPGSAQRSPMTSTFADAASSPKFARAFSSSSNTTVGQGGSLAPPTPLTPNEMPRFPSWQTNTVIRSYAPMPEHSSPESLNANWAVEPQSAGIHTSPPSTPLDLGQINQARFANDGLYRDTPPQSAPATQQHFPRTSFMAPPQLRAGFHSSTDLTIAQPKPSHFRRPSLPDGGHAQFEDPHIQFPVQYGDSIYDQKFHDISLEGISHNVPFAPPLAMPEFLVHEYTPPHGMGGPPAFYRRPTEPQPKSYIFANQGPRDFKA